MDARTGARGIALLAVVWLSVAFGCSSSATGQCDEGAGGGFPGGGGCPDAGSVARDAAASGSGHAPPPTSTGGGVVPGGACGSDADCDSSQCDVAAKCVDWQDGKGGACACTCSWGTECKSGCCGSVNGGEVFACRSASACAPIGGSCSHQYECENGNCGTSKTYCYGDPGTCGCGCSQNSDCASGCCAPYGNPVQFHACSAAGTPGC